eukprot:CAMPEP_0195068884 /NCGR_PEP_ID=MMETSP0448-20130528/13398_1 /TAXON_ID=66468 /ORGANISM="Heterocapsa triquestra, Strain CCMP 448" /LENGTH=859 /DNA_ID=CAMNT_0040100431 /DNA_START=9 /DNA_END=2588 /DNA_ORIENTATION=-
MGVFAWLGRAALLLASAWAADRQYTVAALLRPPHGAVEALEKRALEVSDPESAAYGHYLTQKEVTKSIGLSRHAAKRAAAWLAAALESVKAHATTHVTAHRDVVTAKVADFSATYDLGIALMEAKLPQPPDRMELLVTPNMPDDLCHELSHEEPCRARPPCHWRGGGSGGSCAGGFGGWICWSNATDAKGKGQWHCFEAKDSNFIPEDATRAQRDIARRRGRFHGHAAQRPQAPVAAQEPKDLGFSVTPKSEAFMLSYYGKPGHGWASVELTYAQQGAFHTKLLHPEDFTLSESGLFGSVNIGGIANMRSVRTIAVCLNTEGSHVPSTDKGCVCTDRGTDERLARGCQRLGGFTPHKEPVDFILPRGAETLSALQKDLGVGHGSAASPLGGGGGKVELAMGEFVDQSFSQADIVDIKRAYGLRVPRRNATIFGVPSPKEVNGDNSGEGSLDIQIAAQLAPEANPGWWAQDPYFMEGYILAYAVQVNDDADPPLVHSISWGDSEDAYPEIFVRRIDYEVMKWALRGLTMVVSSGDNGLRSTYSTCDFGSDLLAASPWITSVGATMTSLASKPYCDNDAFLEASGACEELGPVPCSVMTGAIMTSSGYFSLYRRRPAYQEVALAEWLATAECAPCRTGRAKWGPKDLTTPCQFVNTTSKRCALAPLAQLHRGVPDVTAPGSGYPTYVNGSLGLFDGTSASAPAFAAIVAKLNHEQRRRGEPSLGLLNPWLYKLQVSHPRAFVDVVVGDIGSTCDEACDWGWRAQAGWDPASGLGVPVYDALWEHLPRKANQGDFAAEATEHTPPSFWAGAGLGALAGAGAVSALVAAGYVVLRSGREARCLQRPAPAGPEGSLGPAYQSLL